MWTRRAFTLIEMLAATVIAAMVMAAVIAVLVNLTRAETAQKVTSGERLLDDTLRRLVAYDIAHAERVRLAAGGFSLSTNATLDPREMEFEHQPTVVTYAVKKIGARSWLARTQESSESAAFTELIGAGILSISIEGQSELGQEWKPISARVTVKVSLDGKNRPPLEFVFVKAVPP